MNYMLDTNICIYIINNKPQSVIDKFLSLNQNDKIFISSITIAELFYGLEKSKSQKKEQNRDALIKFLTPFEIVTYDENSAIEYAKIRAKLEKNGEIIGSNDMLIASQAKDLGYILVTNNTKEFQRVNGLIIANWV